MAPVNKKAKLAHNNFLSFVDEDKNPSLFEKHSKQMTTLFKRFLTDESLCKIRKYQLEAVFAVENRFLKDQVDNQAKILRKEELDTKPAIIVAPTGAGKSGMIVMLPYVLASEKVLVITPSLDIRDQIKGAFGGNSGEKNFFQKVELAPDTDDGNAQIEKLMEKVDVIENASNTKSCAKSNLVIVNAQKFAGNAILGSVFMDKTQRVERQMRTMTNLEPIVADTKVFFQGFDTLIVDEAHHYPAKTWVNIINQFKSSSEKMKKLIFLTATPYKKGKNGELEFIKLPNGVSLENRKVFEILPSDVEGFTTRKRKFVQSKQNFSEETFLKDVLGLFEECKKKENRYQPKAMVLVRQIEEAKNLTKLINDQAGYEIAIAAVSQNKDCLEKFRLPVEEGGCQIAITCNKGKEGYDNDAIVVCVIKRNVQSKTLFEQFIGRCARIKRGLEGGTDQNEGIIFSYPEYKQQANWDELKYIANQDPADELDD